MKRIQAKLFSTFSYLSYRGNETYRNLAMALAAVFLVVGQGATAAPAATVLQIAEDVAQCRDTAYDTCKNRECDRNSEYCSGSPADIERSPWYSQEIASCITNQGTEFPAAPAGSDSASTRPALQRDFDTMRAQLPV